MPLDHHEFVATSLLAALTSTYIRGIEPSPKAKVTAFRFESGLKKCISAHPTRPGRRGMERLERLWVRSVLW